MNVYFISMVLIFLGVTLALGALFNFHIPVFRLLFAFMLVYWGVNLLISPGSKQRSYNGTGSCSYQRSSGDYVTLFGNQSLDMSGITDMGASRTLVYVCASGTLILDAARPVRLIVKNVASRIDIPQAVFNQTTTEDATVFTTRGYPSGNTLLTLELIAVLSSVTIITK